MRIIDVDSHFNEPHDWFEKANPALAAKLPRMSVEETLLDVVVGDLFSSVPPQLRPDPRSLLPAQVIQAYDDFLAGGDPPQVAVDAGAFSPEAWQPEPRLAWLDKRGIDVQILLPSNGYHPYRHAMRKDPSLALATLDTYNHWALEQMHGYTDRLIPAVVVDLMDVEWSIAQVVAGREKGSRAVFVKADPHDGKALNHPDFEPFWATCEDLGVAILFHVGGGRAAMHPGWANNGGDLASFYRVASLSRRLVPQLALAAMIFGGVLERYPRLAVIVQELGIDWLPDFLMAADNEADNSRPKMLSFAPYNFPLKPSEYMQRQVCVSVVHQQDMLRPTIEKVPEGLIVFSSDFPHIEGHQEAHTIYGQQLEGLSQGLKESFFGKRAAQLLDI
ncbi:MAG: amidohydrolase [Erythrobacter sp.]|nr:amidohydrolase [Erythrobacter sp.]